MKAAFLLLAVIGLANAFVIPGNEKYNAAKKSIKTRNLNDLLQQFASFIPFDKCLEIVNRYMQNDPDVQKAWAFLQSDTFYALTDKVEKMQEYQDFLKYLADSGLDIYTYENIIRQILGLPPIEHLTRYGLARESGIIKMINEILAALPVDEIVNWFKTVCLPDPDFQKLIERILSPEFQKLVDSVTSSPEYQELTNVLRDQGIDVEAIEKTINDFINGLISGGKRLHAAKKSTRNLNDLLQQFASFIPFDKCLEIVNRYMQNDPDVQKAWAFLQSDTFYALTDKVEKMQEYQDFLKYLADSGLDIYTYENIIRQILGLPPIEHLTRYGWARESGIIKMINEILAALPVDEIVNWFKTVCLPDPDFQKLIERILSPEFQKLVDSVTSSPEYQELTNVLRDQGIDVEAIEKTINDFINGLISGGKRFYAAKKSTRNLNDLLQQFASFIPFDKCLEIVNRYMQNDPDVQKAWSFLQSGTFYALTDKVEKMQEYQDFLKYLSDSGLDIYTYENIIRQILGLPPIEHLTRYGWARESGIIKMINEILAALPVDEIVNWFKTVCLPDPDFQKLIERILSPEFQKLVDSVTSSPEYQELTNVLRDQGIDVEAIEKTINDFINGLISGGKRFHATKKSTRNLNDLLQQFASFIPFDKCLEIVNRYMQNDPDVQKAWAFLQSDTFYALTDKVEKMQEYQDFLKYLADSGLDIYTYENIIRQILGLPPIEHLTRYGWARESGIIKMINEILAALPVDEIVNWFKTVCLPDPDFQKLIERILSPEFQKLVDSVTSSPEYQELTNVLRDQGIDVEAIEKTINDFISGLIS